jgi:hypothetical protein
MFDGTATGELSAGAPLSGRLEVECGRRTFPAAVPFSYPDYMDPRERNSGFSGLLARHDDSVSPTGPVKPGRV